MQDNNKKNSPESVRRSIDGIRRPQRSQTSPSEVLPQDDIPNDQSSQEILDEKVQIGSVSKEEPIMPEKTQTDNKPIILGPESGSVIEFSVVTEKPEPQPIIGLSKEPKQQKIKNLSSRLNFYHNRDRKVHVLVGLLVFLILLAGGSTIYFYKKSKKPLADETTPVSEQQLKETLALVSKIALLPENDKPVLAIVSDPSQLKADAFFVDSKVGDRALVYPFIGRAFLYRPSTNQIINIMTFLPDSPESSALATSTVPIGNNADTR